VWAGDTLRCDVIANVEVTANVEFQATRDLGLLDVVDTEVRVFYPVFSLFFLCLGLFVFNVKYVCYVSLV